MSNVINKMKKEISESEIVSFDIFDTLLFRNVIHPTDIFKVVEKKYFKSTGEKINFYNLRIDSELKARKCSKEEDINLDEIYSQIKLSLNIDTELLKKLEIESEKEFLIPNNEIKEVYNYARELGKIIYIISDMYLPTKIIKDLLKINGYEEYDEIYVSSELRKTKATSSIYKFIRQKNNISKGTRWIHIGDNKHSDIINAEMQGIKGCYYQRILDIENIDNVKTLSDSICKAVQVNMKHDNKNKEYWYKFGIEQVFPIYIGFSKWILDKMYNKDNIYFLSRDGYVPYIIYNKLRNGNCSFPEGKYLYASRRAYQYPYMLSMGREEAIDILTAFNMNLNQKITLREILQNVGLEEEKYIGIISSFGINNFDDVIKLGKSLDDVKKFLNHIWNDISIKLDEELDILSRYFKIQNIDKYNKINIVDIGWRGSTQLAMKNILNKEIDGFYFGTNENVYDEIKVNSYGYAFNLGKSHKKRKFIMEHVMMYELIFSAPHGSLINFEQNENGKVEPLLKNVEGNKRVYNIMKCFQDGAIDTIDRIIPYLEYIDELSSEYCLNNFEDFINRKNIDDLIEFNNLSNSVGFGESKDIKAYVNVSSMEEYKNNKPSVFEKAKFSLWKGAIILHDEEGNICSLTDLDRKAITKYMNKDRFKIINLLRLAKKAIKNPKKAIYRLKFIIDTKI